MARVVILRSEDVESTSKHRCPAKEDPDPDRERYDEVTARSVRCATFSSSFSSSSSSSTVSSQADPEAHCHQEEADAGKLKEIPGGSGEVEKEADSKTEGPEDGWTCCICLGVNPDEDEAADSVCPMNHKFCKACLAAYCVFSVDQEKSVIRCPMAHACQSIIAMERLRAILPPESFESFVRLQTRDRVHKGEWMLRCRNVFCEGITRLENPGTQRTYSCAQCHQVWPLKRKYRSKYHSLMCRHDLSLEDKQLAFYIFANTKPCPYCGEIIEKNGGCPRMTCSKCSNSFCWKCGGKFSRMPLIGQHNSMFGLLGCRKNLFPGSRVACYSTRCAVLAGCAVGAVTVGPIVGTGFLMLVGARWVHFKIRQRRGYYDDD